MTTLQDTLTNAIQNGFYRNSKSPQIKYIQFKESFGSLRLYADTYDQEGNLMQRGTSIPTDGLTDRETLELVPESELPLKLRELSKE